MSNAPQPSIRFLLARNAPVGVLLRRGPSKMFQMLLWDLETDEVTPGQWLQGKVADERCDLSPDGKLLVLFAYNYRTKGKEPTWTAISRPPYFTALSLWYGCGTYYGGGLFQEDGSLVLNGHKANEYSKECGKPKIHIGTFNLSLKDAETRRMIRDGWQAAKMTEAGLQVIEAKRNDIPRHVPRIMVKTSDGFSLSETLTYRKALEIRTYTASFNGDPIDVKGAKQVDVDGPRSRLVYTVKGKLFAHDGTSIKEIADLTANSFKPVPPPDWAKQWP